MNQLPALQTTCPFCSSPIDITDIFCPTCGKNLKEQPLSTGIWTQGLLYAVSFLLPPLFILWTIKYLKTKDPKTKKIGYISLGLMIISILLGIWLSIGLSGILTKEVNMQFNQYQTIGF